MGSDPIVDAEQLARTYDGGRSVDAWERVQEYREAMRYRSKHPNKGSSAMASALEMPRGRIRSWLNGSKPDAVNAIEIARDCDWIETGPGEPTFEALNALVANVFSAGSITEDSYRPAFVLDADRRQLHILDALDAAGVEYRVVDNRDGRADEARPTEAETVLGRVLVCMGAPTGSKTGPLELPAYLSDAPEETRETWVLCYLENRATEPHNGIVRFREERTDAYLRDLARLIEDVSGAAVSVSEKNVMLSRDATEALGFA